MTRITLGKAFYKSWLMFFDVLLDRKKDRVSNVLKLLYFSSLCAADAISDCTLSILRYFYVQDVGPRAVCEVK